jgi:glutaredoxin
MADHKVVAYLKPSCGWSGGVRAVLDKFGLPFEDKDIINNPDNYREMVMKSGQPLQPCVEIDGQMIADISGDELEAWLVENNFQPAGPEPTVPTDSSCTDEEHEAMARAVQSETPTIANPHFGR